MVYKLSIDDKVDQAVNRMFEYYDREDLCYFVDYCNSNKLPYNEAMLFLDGQTRADYYVLQIKPRIQDYMKRVKQYNEHGGFDNER